MSTKYRVNSCSNFGDEVHYLHHLSYQEATVSIFIDVSGLLKDSVTVLRLEFRQT
jgi:hypothetical protein